MCRQPSCHVEYVQKGPQKMKVFPCCSKCLAHVLWTTTNDFMKKQHRYRGKCPFCKAEFCHEDLVILSFPPVKTPSPPVSLPPPTTPPPKKPPPPSKKKHH
ncbi:hypothetical protein Pelo_18767 [Pelomyxa schiedti]|nr:hypothetical protein Pelo_18767 [Pelomyxa schiedti]